MDELLLEQDVERALRRENIKHPLLGVLDHYDSQLVSFAQEYRQLGRVEGELYTKRNFGFFVDAVEGAGDFNLGPLELIAVWSRINELNLPPYKTTGAVAFAYATIPLTHRKGANRYLLEKSTFPDDLFSLQKEFTLCNARWQTISDNLREIEYFRYGMRKTFLELLEGMGTEEGNALLRQAADCENRSPLRCTLRELRENFFNGMDPIARTLGRITSADLPN